MESIHWGKGKLIKFDGLTNYESVILEIIILDNLPSNMIMPGIKGAVGVKESENIFGRPKYQKQHRK